MKISINDMTFWGLSDQEKNEARKELQELRDGVLHSKIQALKTLVNMRCFIIDIELDQQDQDHITTLISDYLM